MYTIRYCHTGLTTPHLNVVTSDTVHRDIESALKELDEIQRNATQAIRVDSYNLLTAERVGMSMHKIIKEPRG